jgi:hypothetical protein
MDRPSKNGWGRVFLLLAIALTLALAGTATVWRSGRIPYRAYNRGAVITSDLVGSIVELLTSRTRATK